MNFLFNTHKCNIQNSIQMIPLDKNILSGMKAKTKCSQIFSQNPACFYLITI
jgi:hypothetical protein